MERHPDPGSSFGWRREPSQAPQVNRTQIDDMTWDRSHDVCSRRGFRQKELKAVLKARLTKMDAAEEKRNFAGDCVAGHSFV